MERSGPIRTFDVGEVFTSVFRAYLANLGPFLLIAFLSTVPGLVLAVRIARLLTPPSQPVAMFEVFGWQLLGGLFTSFGYGLMAWGAFQWARGRRPDAADYLDALRRRGWAILLVAILFMAILIGGMMLCCVPGILAAVVLYVALPATVVEGTGPIESLQRSWDLTEGHRWRVFGVIVLVVLVGMVVQFPVQLVLMATVDLLVTQVALTALGALLIPMHASALGLVYYHLRSIKEYVDADDIADVFS